MNVDGGNDLVFKFITTFNASNVEPVVQCGYTAFEHLDNLVHFVEIFAGIADEYIVFFHGGSIQFLYILQMYKF